MLALLRLIFTLGLIGGAIYGVLFVLADVIEPAPTQIVVPVPLD